MGKKETRNRPKNNLVFVPEKTRIFLFRVLFAFIIAFAAVHAAFSQTPEQLEQYSRMIRSRNSEEKRDALYELRNFRSETASRTAVPAVSDVSAIVRATAAATVAYLPGNEAVTVLTPLLSDPEALTRVEAALALGSVGDPSAVNALVGLLQKDKKRRVRAAAAIALGMIGDPKAVPALVSSVQKRSGSKYEFLRRSSARAIGQIAQFLQTGEKASAIPESYLPERYKSEGTPSLEGLESKFPVFARANDVLSRVIRNPKTSDDLKREAVYALGEIRSEGSAPLLRSLTSSGDPSLAEAVREALRKIARR